MAYQALSPIHPSRDSAATFGGIVPSNLPNCVYSGADSVASILQSECLLPSQYNALVRKSEVEAGESRLLLAVLKDALRIYLKAMDRRTAQARRDFREVCQWFYGENQEGLFAYEHLCEALGIHPGSLRRWLRLLRPDAYRPDGQPIAGR